MGEEMGLAFTLTAQNASNGTTPNYTGALARLDGNTLANWTKFKDADGNRINDSIGLRAINSDPNGKTTFDPAVSPPRLTVSAPSGTWAAGVGTLTARLTLARPKDTRTPDGPFEYLDLGIAPRDADGVEVLPGALDLDSDNDGTNERAKVTQAKVRFGRLRLLNAHGSELLRLPVPLFVEFWNGSGFIKNRDDSCTQVPVPTSAVGGGLDFPATAGNNLAAEETTATLGGVTAGSGTLASGEGGLWLSRPGAGNHGYVNLSLTAPDYLKYNWNGTDEGADGNWFDDNPTARARFGVYKNANEFIYMRENY
jgi:MSHA biogenesis protein MshQ